MGDAGRGREWRQFRLLSRDSVRRIVSAALLSRASDPSQFALWVVAAVAIPPAMYAFNRMLQYTSMGVRWTPDYELVLLADRMYFVLYVMVASALLAALLWQGLLPDATDQEVIGPLPVRDRTLAAARLSGAFVLASAFAIAVSVPSALIFSVVSATHPAFGWLPVVAVAHVGAAVAGSLTVFGLLLVLRATVASLFGARASERLALLLQLAVISLIFAVVFFLPAVLSWLVRAMLEGGSAATLVPAIWFTALYSWAVGASHDAISEGAVRAVVALTCVAGVVLPVYIFPAALVARRTRESRGQRQSGVLTRAATAVTVLVPGVQRRTLVSFTIISLARSHRHLLIVMTYAGAGVAIGASRLVTSEFLASAARPTTDAAVLLLPLAMMLFLIAGLRYTFAIPTDLEANWPFRLSPPSQRTARSASLAVVMAVGVGVPLLAFATVAAALGWPGEKIIAASAFDASIGAILAQLALRDWVQIPFACGHVPLQDSVKSAWLRFLFLLIVLGFVGSEVQEATLRSTRGVVISLTVVVAAAIVIVFWQQKERREPLRFDAQDDGAPETLGLSEASS